MAAPAKSTRTAASAPLAVVRLTHEKDATRVAVWKGEAENQRFGVAWCVPLADLAEGDRGRKIRVTVEWDD